MLIDSSRGKVTASFLNGEIVFHGIALRPRVEQQKKKPAGTSIGTLEASNGRMEGVREINDMHGSAGNGAENWKLPEASLEDSWKVTAKSITSTEAQEAGSFHRKPMQTSTLAMEASWKASEAGSSQGRKLTRLEALSDLLKLIERGERPSQKQLSLRWDVPSGTVSKWCKRWRQSGEISRQKFARASTGSGNHQMAH
jgi:hypothetical protein